MLELNNLLSRYVPEAAAFEADITLEHLIYHTSGLPCLFEIAEEKGIHYFSDFSKENILKGVLEKTSVYFTPGTKYQYSNTGYMFLAQVVEHISGLTFSEFIKKEIFDSSGMRHSFVSDGLNKEQKAVTGYQKFNNTFYSIFSPWGVVGAGLVHSSVTDLLKWGRNFLSGSLGGQRLLNKMLTPLPSLTDAGIVIEIIVLIALVLSSRRKISVMFTATQVPHLGEKVIFFGHKRKDLLLSYYLTLKIMMSRVLPNNYSTVG